MGTTLSSTRSLPRCHAAAPLALAVQLAFATLACGLLAAPVLAQPGAQQAEFNYEIAPGPLADALNQFAQQSGVSIIIETQSVAGRRSAGLQGRHGIDEGFATLLQGSGFVARRGGNGYVLVPLEGSSLELGATTITGLGDQNSTSYTPGYVAKRNLSATKTDTPIIETPQSLSVVTSDEIRDRQAETLSQALNLTPGFTSQPTSFNRTSDRFRIRGFDVESATGGSLRDGLRLQNNSYDGVQEPYGLERAEVIRGAASVLYGQLSPGGLINGVSKRPTRTPYREVNLQLDQDDRRQVSADLSGPLGDSETLSYRLTMLNRDSSTPQDHIDNDKLYIAPALTWRPNDDTSLTLLSFYQKTRTGFSAPLAYQLVEGVGSSPYKIGRHDFIGEPDYDKMDGEMSAVGYEFEHHFSEHLRISHKLRYYESEVEWNYLQINNASLAGVPVTGILGRQYSDRTERSRGIASDTNVEGNWHFGDWQHRVLVGFDGYDTSYDSNNFRGNAPALDLARYNYGQPVVVDKSQVRNRGSQVDTLQKGIYLQDQITFDDRWVLVLGGRHDWANQDLEAHRDGSSFGADNEATTWRAGLVYKADNGLAPYVSYSQSFFPVAVADAPGLQFAPTEGEQYEVGIRYQPPGSNLLLSAAVYELTQTDVLKHEPSSDTYTQTGEVRSRGLELEARADLTRNASMIASYAYVDARITDSIIAAEVGQRSEDTPYHQAAVWLDYRFSDFGLPQLRVAAGARYKGSTQASGIDSGLPAYTLFDAMASYSLSENWEVSVNAVNLANKKYTYCEFAICRYGDERQVVSAVSYRW